MDDSRNNLYYSSKNDLFQFGEHGGAIYGTHVIISALIHVQEVIKPKIDPNYS